MSVKTYCSPKCRPCKKLLMCQQTGCNNVGILVYISQISRGYINIYYCPDANKYLCGICVRKYDDDVNVMNQAGIRSALAD